MMTDPAYDPAAIDPADPGNSPEVIALAAAITASWVHPPFTTLDRGELLRQLKVNGVTLREARLALDDLVAEGGTWQPRAPQLIAAVRRRRAQREGQTPDYDRVAISAHASVTPDELEAQADDVANPQLAHLIRRVANASRIRTTTRERGPR
jgi:hypothetical protein